MTQIEHARPLDRILDALVVRHLAEGSYRVHSPGDPSRIYHVEGLPDAPRCECPDFVRNENDPDYRCRHVLAVEHSLGGNGADPGHDNHPGRGNGNGRTFAVQPSSGSSESRMVLKRSVSPDGRIDSLSIEFHCPVTGTAGAEVRSRAKRLLDLQTTIVGLFLGRGRDRGDAGDHTERPECPSSNGNGSNAMPARLLEVAGMTTRYGRRLFVNVQVNGDVLKLFGSRKQLASALAAAGYPDAAQDIEEGVELDLPCRITTKRSDDGRYVNVDRLFPAQRGRR